MNAVIQQYRDRVEAVFAKLGLDLSAIRDGIGSLNTTISTLRSDLEQKGSLEPEDQEALDQVSNDASGLLANFDALAAAFKPPTPPVVVEPPVVDPPPAEGTTTNDSGATGAGTTSGA